MPTHPTTVRDKSQGFTLIELLVVSGISALLLLTVTSMFATFLMSNVRTNLRRQVQTEGNAAIERIEFLIRNASSVSICTQNNMTLTYNNSIYIIDIHSSQIRLSTQNPPSAAVINYLTSTKSTVATPTSSNPLCAKTDSPTIVTTRFTLTAASGSTSTSQYFSSRTLVRNTAF